MITKQLIDQIEGEASVYFDMKNEKVSFSTIAFPHFRGIENILKGKDALDALVITPRVCGICGHAHLLASVRAIEDAYKNAGYEVQLSTKAKKNTRIYISDGDHPKPFKMGIYGIDARTFKIKKF